MEFSLAAVKSSKRNLSLCAAVTGMFLQIQEAKLCCATSQQLWWDFAFTDVAVCAWTVSTFKQRGSRKSAWENL